MNNPELSIIIVDYNSDQYVLVCLKSIIARSGTKYEIIVVDNASKVDNTEKYKISNNISVIRSEKNLGFGGANNLGAASAVGKYLFLLNPDTLIFDGSIDKLLDFARSHDKIGIVGPKILIDKNGPEEQDYYGDFPTVSSLLNRNNHHHIVEHPEGYLEVERFTGSAMMLKRDLFLKVDGFDDRFFMYFEDTDLCKKISDAGFACAVLPSATIIHFGGKTINSTKTKKDYYYRSQDYFFKKHYGIARMCIVKLLRFPYRFLKQKNTK